MKPTEIIKVDADVETVSCDGGGGPLGHPMVYFNFGPRDEIECTYCSRRFVRGGSGTGGERRHAS